MSEKFSNSKVFNADLSGSLTAFACAVHCSFAPLITSVGLVNIPHSLHHTIDWFMLSIGLVFAFYSIIRDYLKTHKNILPTIISGVGFILLTIGISTHHEGIAVMNVLGGMTIMISHFINYKLNRSVQCCV